MKYIITLMFGCSLLAQQTNTTQDTLTVSTVTLSTVTVSALRANEDTPMAFTNISEKELNKQNLGKDLPVLMRFLPREWLLMLFTKVRAQTAGIYSITQKKLSFARVEPI